MRALAIFLCSLLFVSYGVVLAQEMPPVVDPTSCMRKFGISIMDIPKLLTDQSEETQRQRGCLEACNLQRLGWMNGNNIETEKIMAQAEAAMKDTEGREKVLDSIRKCLDSSAGSDECDVAQKLSSCALDQLRMGMKRLLQTIAPQA